MGGGRDVYALAVFAAGVLACADAPLAVGGLGLEKVYVATVAGVALLNGWTTRQMQPEVYSRHSRAMCQLLDVLLFLGFAELETIQERAGARSPRPRPSDPSISKHDQDPARGTEEQDEYAAPSPSARKDCPSPSTGAHPAPLLTPLEREPPQNLPGGRDHPFHFCDRGLQGLDRQGLVVTTDWLQ
ncbi:hypothetical protein CALCODRAFT_491266 [Calocera cornea HHB12733]|uniref:Uncharacterized protein n=1 Tax=Calocera cornea HHB12733 TaxID=1353952 RepID=A0A165J701_9BASI|nr:hypothetical protein CALCODRAFT_491266 [Calocera cornea HHB12733]